MKKKNKKKWIEAQQLKRQLKQQRNAEKSLPCSYINYKSHVPFPYYDLGASSGTSTYADYFTKDV